jgi:hypothetical protein
VSANSDCCDLHLGNYRSTLYRVIFNLEGENILISFDCVTVHGTDTPSPHFHSKLASIIWRRPELAIATGAILHLPPYQIHQILSLKLTQIPSVPSPSNLIFIISDGHQGTCLLGAPQRDAAIQ